MPTGHPDDLDPAAERHRRAGGVDRLSAWKLKELTRAVDRPDLEALDDEELVDRWRGRSADDHRSAASSTRIARAESMACRRVKSICAILR